MTPARPNDCLFLIEIRLLLIEIHRNCLQSEREAYVLRLHVCSGDDVVADDQQDSEPPLASHNGLVSQVNSFTGSA
jgi:hypothetical protein